MSLSIFVVFALLGVTLGDKPSSGYGAPSIPQVKYGGPIVYSAEKPPIIHFPPPPADVSQKQLTTNSMLRSRFINEFLEYLKLMNAYFFLS